MARGHTFLDPAVKEEMIDYRRQGYSYVEIGRKYHVHHSTIIYHCQKAGLTLGENDRKKVFDLIQEGFSASEVALKLNIPSTVVDFYCYRDNVEGEKLLFRTKLNLQPITPKCKRVFRKALSGNTKIDDRGVEWRKGIGCEWICLGKTEKQALIDAMHEKDKILEKRRAEMLAY